MVKPVVWRLPWWVPSFPQVETEGSMGRVRYMGLLAAVVSSERLGLSYVEVCMAVERI